MTTSTSRPFFGANRLNSHRLMSDPGGRMARDTVFCICDGRVMRIAVPEDVDRLVALMDEFYAAAGYKLNHQRASRAFGALLADERLGRIWLIGSGSSPVGYLVLTFCFSMEYGGLSAILDDFFIQEPFRGRGLGKAALAEVRSFCEGYGVRAINVETGFDNAVAQTVYRRTGFVNTDRQLMTLKLAQPSHD